MIYIIRYLLPNYRLSLILLFLIFGSPANANFSDREIELCATGGPIGPNGAISQGRDKIKIRSGEIKIQNRDDLTTTDLARILDRAKQKKISIFKLNIEGCPKLKAIPPEINDFSDHLLYLKIRKSGIKTVDRTITNLRNLINVDLSNNKITSIPLDLCNLPDLTYLSITHNNLRISDEFKTTCDRNLPTFRYVRGNRLLTPLQCNHSDFGLVSSLKGLKLAFSELIRALTPGKPVRVADDPAPIARRQAVEEAYRRLSYPKRSIGQLLDGQTLPDRSSQNLTHLRESLGPLSEQEQSLYQRLEAIPFTLKHHTSSTDTIMNQGKGLLLSNDELFRRGIRFSDNSQNESDFGNRDFVFFNLSTGDDPIRGSRFGDQVIVIQPDRLYENGWVYFHDLMATDSSELKNKVTRANQTLEIDGKKRREVAVKDVWLTNQSGNRVREHEFTVKYWNHSGEETGPQTYRDSDRFFYGPDIKPGVCLSLLKEIRNMGIDYEDRLLNLPEDEAQKELIQLLSRFYRIQALIPNQVDLNQEKPRIIPTVSNTVPSGAHDP